MDLEAKRFGRGPRELGGATDLINLYKLWPHHEFFCKRSLPLSISETHYLHNVVGDTLIRKGEGMDFDQLFQSNLYMREKNAHIHPFDLDVLCEAFLIRETTPVKLPSAEKGICTSVVKSKSELENKEKKHKKHKDKDKDHKKHKNRHKDNSGDAVKNINVDYGLKTEQLKEREDMFIQKRRLDGFEDPSVFGHKKSRIQR
ncbi:hypothetical protein L3X38_021722 [Prunus dulcis]|uniref:Mediator of RNA polymerase II transcription subunit 19b n=1 Tax=Prunus dulcis TaxID=3755 RepID=A0AAD4Z3P9_PRUDU|nr:hypothetical protein L3X38_021722 [Prunus dulcis]